MYLFLGQFEPRHDSIQLSISLSEWCQESSYVSRHSLESNTILFSPASLQKCPIIITPTENPGGESFTHIANENVRRQIIAMVASMQPLCVDDIDRN